MRAEAVRNLTDQTSFVEAAILPQIPLLGQVEILGVREGGLVECLVPKELIDHEEVPVKEEWAVSLARQMRERSDRAGGTGQKTPVQLGWIEGEHVFRIVDGFHRDAALVINEASEIFATVEQTDWNTLYDDRIFTAKDHAHVRFSRVVKWMNEVWQHSGLDDKLSLEQAILLYRYEGSGRNLGLSPEAAEVAKQWVAIKEQKWDTPAMTIHSYLQTAEKVDPMLVNATRERRNGKAALIAPTQQIIGIFSEMLPNDFELQNLVWEITKAHNLKSTQIKAICDTVRDHDSDAARNIIAELDVAHIEPLVSESHGRHLRRAADPRHKGASVLKAAKLEIERVNLRVRQSIDRGEEVDGEMKANLDATVAEAKDLRKALGKLAANLMELREKSGQSNVVSLSKKQISKAYERHQQETAANTHREPQPRLRKSDFAIELPAFGELTYEDWAAIEDHHRFALALNHPEITQGSFQTKSSLYMRILELAGIIDIDSRPTSSKEFQELVSAKICPLTAPLSPMGESIISIDKELGRPVITPSGKQYLSEVVKNVLIAVDDSKN